MLFISKRGRCQTSTYLRREVLALHWSNGGVDYLIDFMTDKSFLVLYYFHFMFYGIFVMSVYILQLMIDS